MTTRSEYKILIVDDENDLAEVIQSFLEDYSTEIRNNGKDALEAVMTGRYDLILSDINMPLMDGLQFFEEIRKKGIKTPLIFITAFSDTQKIRKAWQLGAFDFLDKPINFEILNSIVKKALIFGVEMEKSRPKESLVNIPLSLSQAEVDTLSQEAKEKGMTIPELLESKIKKQ